MHMLTPILNVRTHFLYPPSVTTSWPPVQLRFNEKKQTFAKKNLLVLHKCKCGCGAAQLIIITPPCTCKFVKLCECELFFLNIFFLWQHKPEVSNSNFLLGPMGIQSGWESASPVQQCGWGCELWLACTDTKGQNREGWILILLVLVLHVQITTGANAIEEVVFKQGFWFCVDVFCFVFFMTSWYTEQSDHKHRINFN